MRLRWAWLEQVRDVEIAEVLWRWKGQGVVGLVGDHTAFHRLRAVKKAISRRICLR